MGTITANIGLISGINYSQLVSELVQVASGPVNNQTTIDNTYQQQQTAITSLEATLIALQSTTNSLSSTSLYNQRTVTSSDPSTLTATVTGSPQQGQYQLTPVQAAQNQQLQSSRFSSDSTPLGAGTLTLQNGGFVNPAADLDLLNGGEGFSRGEIEITDRSGASAVVDLRFARNIDDVLTAINSAGIGVKATTNDDQLVLTDTTGKTTSNLKVDEVGGGTTAASLGLSGINTAANQVSGADVVQLFGDLSLNLLNDSTGVRFDNALPDLQINFRDGTSTTVDFHQLAGSGANAQAGTNEQTLNDVINTLNAAAPGKLHAAISTDGSGLVLTDLTTDSGGTFSVTDLNNSKAAYDLGINGAASGGTITGQPILGGLKTVLLSSLNGGNGFGTLGNIQITDRSGASATVNLSSAKTLDDVISAINAAGIGVHAQVNDAGNGIEVNDTTGASTSNLIIANGDATNSADKLGLTVNAATTSQSSGSLNLQTVSENTLLSSLNGGGGVGTGKVQITDTNNNSATLTVGSSIKTVGDLINAINLLNIGVQARVNDAGNGILLVDTAHGSGSLTATSVNGTTAQDLHLLGGAQTVDVNGTPTQEINGSTALTISISSTDTLEDLVTKINNASIGVQAAATSDGSSVKPFRLTLFNNRSGQAGQLLVDTSGANFSVTQTVAPQDAVVVLGSPNSTNSVLASSPNGTFSNLLPGLSVNVLGGSANPVTITVGSTNSTLGTALQNLVDAYNKVHTQIQQITRFDPTSNTGAVLQGDPTVLQVDTDLSDLISGPILGNGTIQSLAQLGITTAQDGSLQFDQSVFQTVYSQNPQAVQDFLTNKGTGVSDQFNKLLDSLAGPDNSLLVARATTLSNKLADGQQRIDLLNAQLDSLRTRLTTQFQNSELAIAQIQSNLSAISSIQPFLFLNSGSSSSTSSSAKSASLGNLTG
jgi:flagellar hook-associated protein 2